MSYLKNQHQFIVVTHIETNNIHNHIIFNDINYETLNMFDSKRLNSLYRLRVENDKISEKYNLSIIESGRKNRYLEYGEYIARMKKQSFKEKLENAIDKNISLASNFNEFLDLMKKDGFECKRGKYLAFKNPKSNKFMRTKTLGIDYLENSIKFRIENKNYRPIKPKIIYKEWIDKNSDKFKNNKSLQRWATLQNINYLNEINAELYKNNMTLNEYNEIKLQIKNLVENVQNRLIEIDNEINDLENMIGTFEEIRLCIILRS